MECICKLDNASKVVPLCETCVAKYNAIVSDDNNPHDNDVYDIIEFCSFTTTSYDPAAANSVVGSMSSATDASASFTRSGTGTGAGSESGKSGSSTTPTAATGTTTVNAGPIPVPMGPTTVAIMGLLTLGWL